MSDLLTLKALTVKLQSKTILSDVQLTLAAGDILGLVGASGCGKTTLLNTIAGFIEQSQGIITLADTITISPEHTVAPEHRNIGMIFQDYALFPHLTVAQNICFGIDKLRKTEQQSRLEQLVALLKLNDLEQRFPHQISGGQQQRVAIARALAPQPQLLLLDEPFSNIDARLRSELMLEMRQLLKQLNISAIFATHNKDEVFTFADKMAVMYQGKILQVGSPLDLCQQPSSWQVADFLQLGSWLKVTIKQNINKKWLYTTALGNFIGEKPNIHCFISNTHIEDNEVEQSQVLLIKNQHLTLSDKDPVNAQVVQISVTEQGFHYRLVCLNQQADLTINHVSFYSALSLTLNQQVCLQIKPHNALIFKDK